MHDKIPFVSIVFSFRNEEAVLPELIQRTRTVLANEHAQRSIAGWELIFVNDDSNDRSLNILTQHAQGHKDIRVINMSRMFGVAPCLVAGLAHAAGDIIVYMDADLQDPPEVIPQMLEAMRDQNADVVHTVRRSRQGESAFKLFVTKMAYLSLNSCSSTPIPLEAGDFKMLSRRAVDHLLKFKESNPFMRGLVTWIGFKQVFVAYDRQPRFAGKSKFFCLSPHVVGHYFNAALVNFSSLPLKIASYCGLAAIFVDIIVAAHAITQKLTGHAVPGWTALMIVIVFMGGVQLFCIGMIGLYLNSVHEQSKMRPLYIVESTYGFK